jgi:hypothetical protein
MSKPLIIKLREAKANITESVNASLREGIPCYLLEPIVAELHAQITKASEAEFERAVKQQAAEAKAAAAVKPTPEPKEEAGGEEDERAGT